MEEFSGDSPIHFPCEKERARLLSLAAERDNLKKENRSLNMEVSRLRRQARMELSMQRAECIAQQTEREELQLLAAEAQRLINLKDRLANAQAFADAKETAADIWLSDEDIAATQQRLSEEYEMVLQRARNICCAERPALARTGPGCASEDGEDFDEERRSGSKDSVRSGSKGAVRSGSKSPKFTEGTLTERLTQIEMMRGALPPVSLGLRRPRSRHGNQGGPGGDDELAGAETERPPDSH